jgi:hypothetical protein
MNKIYNSYTKLIKKDQLFGRSQINAQITGQPASDLIRDKILEGKPLMVSRFGSTELNCILNYYFVEQGFFKNVKNILTGIPYFLKIKPGIMYYMNIFSGFFPSTEANIKRFCEMSLLDLPEIDILGSWQTHERFLYPYFNPDHIRVQLGDLNPIRHEHPWTIALAGKKVLIVHPFEETIKEQFKKREFLFTNKETLPPFELKTLKAVQSMADAKTQYKSWFEALDFMKSEIGRIDFDIAILGCGAYGMPLAAHIKRIGKQAIHLGGETQALFGIKGKRWETDNYAYHLKFYNDYWVRPSDSEIPEGSKKVEGGAYW